jgi:CBS domain-containing protein
MSVKAILNYDRGKLAKCAPDDTLVQAVKRMVKLGVNALVVASTNDKLVGVLTDHDIMRALDDCDGRLTSELVSVQMSSKVITCTPDTKLKEALFLMGKHTIRHLVVVEEEHPVAMLSIRDVLARIHQNEILEIDTLRDIAVASRAAVTH